MKIQKLSPDIINKIAAGEVVERPASVIKELVENSLDAGATQIDIEIKEGGKEYISISDNGYGISAQDAPLTIEQHATSKIINLNDLFSINSFGFRGEALASISSVSDFRLQSRQSDDIEGIEVRVIDNKTHIVPTSCKFGTKIEISHLFKNVPARRHYLKRDSTEYNHILDVFTQFALAHPSVSFSLTHNGKQTQNCIATTDSLQRIKQMFKTEVSDAMMKIDTEQDVYKMHGYVGQPHKFFTNRSNQYLFINGRYIKSHVIHKAIMQGYGSLLPHGTQPVYVLNLIIDPAKVDVNVHPRKLEVRFADGQSIFRFVVRGLNQSFHLAPSIKPVEIPKNNNSYSRPVGHSSYSTSRNSTSPSDNNTNAWAGAKNTSSFSHTNASGISNKSSFNFYKDSANNIANQSTILEQNSLGDWVLLGQVKDSYLLVENGNSGLLIVDQHGAAERINYERLLHEYKTGKSTKKQQLLIPLHIELSAKEFNIIMEQTELFEQAGFEIDEFGGTTIVVNTVPTIIKTKDPKKIVEEVLNTIIEGVEGSAKQSYTIDYLLKTIACKSAIKFGDRLSLPEQIKLLQDTQAINDKLACAHGRPIILELGWDYIDRRFERT